jgi:cytochrome c-type biogenesis protein CcmE
MLRSPHWRKRQMNKKKIILIVLIIAFIIIAIFSMRGVLTPYVSFKKAIESGSYVQVIGKLNKETPIKYYEGYFTFSFADEAGTPMEVTYSGVKPLNFEHANQIVALGTFNAQEKIFDADKILIKCPSKYVKENK